MLPPETRIRHVFHALLPASSITLILELIETKLLPQNVQTVAVDGHGNDLMACIEACFCRPPCFDVGKFRSEQVEAQPCLY